jgi:hypothetical protein
VAKPERRRQESAVGARLRRPLLARLFATTLQGVLSCYAVVTIALIPLLIWKRDLSMWPYLLVDAALTLLWLRGFTAWASVDDDGLHWRFWVRWDHPWSEISKVTLTRHTRLMSAQTKGPPIILVRAKDGDEDYVLPAVGCLRHRREFGTEVLAAARTHGIRTEIVSTGWDEKPDHIAEQWA